MGHAAPAITTLEVQGFMKKADGSPVSTGNYDLVFGIFQGGTVIWAKRYAAVPISSGVFSQALEGVGTSLVNLPASTGMNADFSGVALSPALLSHSGNGAVLVRIYAASSIDGRNPQFDVTLNSVPTSFSAGVAESVADGAITLSGLASAVYSTTSSPLKLVQLDSSGKLDSSVYGNIPANQISGVLAPSQISLTASDLPIVPVSKGGTGATSLGSANQVLGVSGSGAAAEYKNIIAGNNVTVAHSMGAITISAATGNGTVTGIVAGNGLTGGTITSAGTIAVNAGTGANQIVQLDASSRLPAVDGSQVTNLNANQIVTGTISAGVLPVAGAAAAGVVTSTNQTLGGDKTFTGTTTMGGAIVLTSNTVPSGGPTPYDGTTSAKVFSTSKSLAFLTGTSVTSISCLAPGLVGQVFHLVATGAIGTGLTVVHNANCSNGARIRTNTNASLRSATTASSAALGFVYSGTEWILFSANL